MTEPRPTTHQRTALWVVPTGDYGGVARHVLDVATATIPGWTTIVLAPPGPLVDECRRRDLAVVDVPFGPDHGLRRSVSSLRRVVARLRPDVVHTHLSYADIAAAVALRRRSGPTLVSTEHGIAGTDLYHSNRLHATVMRAVHRLRLTRFDGVIAVSESTAHQVRRQWRPRAGLALEVIRNGVDPSPTRTARTPGLAVASCSRLAPEKRIDAALAAFALLARDDPAARLTIAGAGPEADRLRALASRLDLDRAVHFAGFMDTDELLPTTDVVVQLSHWENCSYTLLDAMTSGAGVVATAVGGNPELLPPSCLVVADDEIAVADSIRRQGLDPATRPVLPVGWPTVADMTSSIAEFYDRVVAR